MALQLFVPSEAQVREAKFVSDQILLLLMLASQQQSSSVEGRQHKEHLLKRYQQLNRTVRKAAKHYPALLAEWEQQTSVQNIRTEHTAVPPPPSIDGHHPPAAPLPSPEPKPAPTSDKPQLAHNLGPTRINQGEEVQLLQRLLLYMGFKVKVTEQYDLATTQAVKNFQMKKALPITGWVDPKTHAYLNHILSRLKPADQLPVAPTTGGQTESETEEEEWSDTLTLDLGPANQTGKIHSGFQVLLLQELLLQQGYALLTSGDYDKDTIQAVRAFQSAHKLPVNGMVDAKTREKLNHVLAITYAENTFKVDCFQVVLPFRQERGLLTTGLMGWQLNEWWQQLLDLLKQPVPLDEPLWMKPPLQEPILLTQVLGTPGQVGIVSQGTEVYCLQELLQRHGHDVDVNATFDLKTFTALKQWQQAHGLLVSGVADTATRQVMNQQLQARYNEEQVTQSLFDACLTFQNALQIPLSQRAYSEVKAHLHQLLYGTDPPVLTDDMGPSNRPGKISKGPQVVLLQTVLTALGKNLHAINDQYDQALYNEIRQYQKNHALPMTGMVDEKTKAQLNQDIAKLIQE